jgi:Zn-dependent protease with chaperone function
MRTVLGIGVGVVAAAAVIHCAPGAEPPATAEARHTAGEVVNENVPFVWTESDYDSFLAAAQSPLMAGAVPLPAGDAIARRLQAWSDTLDAAARAIVKKESGHALTAPRPTVVVLRSPVRNAWVSPVPACLGGPVDVSQLTVPEGATVTGLPAGGPPNLLRIFDNFAFVASGACVTPSNWTASSALAWQNKQPGACRLEAAAGGGLVVRGPGAGMDASSADCYLLAPNAPPGLATVERAALGSTSTFYFITTTYLAGVPDEKFMATVLAHELGHYYRGHASINKQQAYTYFYEQTNPPLPGKPPKVADSDQLIPELYRLFLAPPPAAIPGARVHPRLRRTMLSLIQTFQALASLPAAAPASAGPRTSTAPAALDPVCTALQASVTPIEGVLWSPSALPPEALPTYLDIESRFLDCASRTLVGLPSSGAHLGSPALEAALRYFFPQHGWAPGAGSESLASIFERLDVVAKEVDVAADAFLAGLNARHLGIYTAEQEADDMSMELMAAIGLDPKEHVDAWFRYMKAIASNPATAPSLGSDGISFEECAALYQNDWTRVDERGQRSHVYVPLGNLIEPHHGYCYRLFNLSRERVAHGHVAGAAKLPTFAEPWSTIHDAAVAASASLGAEPRAARPLAPSSGAPASLPIVESY